MKQVLPYYFVPICIFFLLSLLTLHDPNVLNIVMTILASSSLGLFAGFIFHMATLVMKKVSK